MRQEITDALNEKLDVNLVQVMEVRGNRIPYLESHEVIRAANRIFGYGNWGFEITRPPFVVESGVQGRDSTKYEVWAVSVRLTVDGCQPIEDMGTNTRNGEGAAGLEMAFKGAVSDALKRCLRHYGDQFGLVLYDKDAGDDAFAGIHVPASQGNTPRPSNPAGLHPVQPQQPRPSLKERMHEPQGDGGSVSAAYGQALKDAGLALRDISKILISPRTNQLFDPDTAPIREDVVVALEQYAAVPGNTPERLIEFYKKKFPAVGVS